MKNLTRLLLALALALGLAVSHTEAAIHNTTTLSTTVGTILQPGQRCITWIIQNVGTTNVYLSFDGGSTYTDPNSQKTGTDPTTTTGYLLAPGQQIIWTYTSVPAQIRPIRAISATGTASLMIVTSDTESTFPTT